MTTEPAIDARRFRDTIGRFGTGVTVITWDDGEHVRGMTANSFPSVSLPPPLVLVCVDRNASWHSMMEVADAFAINILASDQRAVSDTFARRGESEGVMHDLPFHDGPLGSPILEGVLGWVECRVEARHAAGDHTILVGRVESMAAADADVKPLLFFAGGYRAIGDPLAP